MSRSFKSYLLVLLALCVMAVPCQASEIAELLELEKIRKTDVEEFQKKLLDFRVKHEVEGLPSDAGCLFEYLIIYSESFGGKYIESQNAVDQLLNRCQGQFETVIRAKSLLTSLQVISGAYQQAIINLNDVIELEEKSDDPYLKAQIHHLASRTYRLINQDELGLKYAHLLINNDTPENVCFGEYNKYRIEMRANFSSVNQSAVRAAINNCQVTSNLMPALFLQFDLYRYGISTDDQAQAIAAIEQLYALQSDVEQTQFKNIRVYYQALLAHVSWLAGRKSEANEWAHLAIKENASIGDSEQLILALSVLIDIALEDDDFANGYAYLEQKSKIEKSLFEQKLAKQVAYFQVKHANLAQELEIEQLNQNNQLLALENQLAAETTKRQQLMMLLILTLLLFLGAWTWKIKKKHDYFKEVAEIDHLTQVFTRKAFEERMRDLLDQHVDSHEPVNLAIMDLDHFKYVNDEHGHLVGDWVLKQAILTCESAADEDILIARLGGEEFAIVSPGIEPGQMLELMNKLRVAIELMDCAESGAELSVTASFGVSHSGLSGYNISMLLTHADLALFEAKNNGRNRVVSYRSVMAQSPVAKIS